MSYFVSIVVAASLVFVFQKDRLMMRRRRLLPQMRDSGMRGATGRYVPS